MSAAGSRSPRRTDALSRARIVSAAVELLDEAEGAAATDEGVAADSLTVRRLTDHLSTGRGAIYHHVSGMGELMAAATDDVIGRAISAPGDDVGPEQAVRGVALGIFDAIDAHPWIGPQLSGEAHQPAVLRLWSAVGLQLRRLGVPDAVRPDAGAALVNYVLGAAAQYATGARRAADDSARARYLEELTAAWIEQDDNGVAGEASPHVREHDDRAQFLAGVDIVLAGIATLSD